VVGGQHQGHAVGVARLHIGGGHGHGRGAVAGLGFDQHGDRHVDLGGLGQHEVDHGPARDDDDLGAARQGRHPQHGVLEAGIVADQLQELLRLVGARSGPQTRARAAAQDHRIDRAHKSPKA
jgi:hypothetical protein